MKQQNHLKTLSLLGGILAFSMVLQSCGASETDSVQDEAINNAKEIFQNLPELKEEIDDYKEKVNAQEMIGTFIGELDGDPFEFNSWQGEKARVSFSEFTGVVYATISRKPEENVTIKVWTDKWYQKKTPYTIPASIYAMEGTDRLEVTYLKKDGNGDYLKRFQTMDGELTVNQFDETGVKIVFAGNGLIGDPREQNTVPLSFELDLNYNFVSSDVRTIQ